MLAPGDILQDRYEIEEMLGKGGFGAVYRARDRRLKRLVALKETLHLDPHILRLFEREAEVLASLEHPSLPGVTDHFSEGETYYTVMSYIPGQDLGEYLANQPQHRTSEQETLGMMLPVLDALEYLHTRVPPVIHRDIKPGNIRMTPEGRVYLVDFGLAKPFDAQPAGTLSVVALTPSFSPPEQYYQQADTRSDLYALGATLYVLLTGTTPLPAHERMTGKELVSPRQYCPELSPQIETIILRLMALSPDQRYQSIAELRQDMQALLAPNQDSQPQPVPALAGGDAPTWASSPVSTPFVAPLGISAPATPQALPTDSAALSQPGAPPPSTSSAASVPTRLILDLDAVTAPLIGMFERLCSAPLVQRIAARLPFPDTLHPARNQIVVGSAGVLLLLLLLITIGWLAGTAATPSMIAMNEETRARVQQATVKIEAEGSFTYPTDAWRSWIGQGSGVIIDPSGIAVTNNHVVAGAGSLQVFVGNEGRPRLARLLGTSECLDLALIDIEGDGFSSLTWYEGSIQPGLAVFAAGFPGGGTITMTHGVITQDAASGETAWASLDSVIEHNASIHPGSSGGPLLTIDGQIIGLNYRSRPNGQRSSLSYAIARDDLLNVLEQLQSGERVLSIGVNGEAVRGDPVSGIWVYSVESGSLADRARVRPGDLITHLEGVPTGDDGTLTKYCRVLRSHNLSDVVAMRVVRASTGETFEGQLNGRELEIVTDPSVAMNPVVISDPAPASTDESPDAEASDTPVPTAISSVSATMTPQDIATASRVSPVNQLSNAELTSRRQAVQTMLTQYEQVLDETFDSRATRTRWLIDNNTANLRHRLINDYYELTLKKPDVGLVDPWNHRHVGDTYMVEMDVAFVQPQLFSAVGILFDMRDSRNFAQFLVHSNGAWQLRTVADDEPVPAQSGIFSTPAIRNTQVNRLRVVRQPDKAEFWINDIPVGVAPVESGGRYYTGITGGSGNDVPVTVLIDNLFVWQ